MDINFWLESFKKNWINHNIEGVLELFDPNVEYYETPFHKLSSFSELEKEWQAIKNQKNIKFDWKLFSSSQEKHAVQWNLEYSDQNNDLKKLAGVYLIRLNDGGKCTYFFHCCENKKV